MKSSMIKRIWLVCVLWVVHLMTASALHRIPTLYIETAGRQPVTSRELWQTGASLRLVLPDGYTAYESEDVQIKSRGHSTFSKPKKPYVFKLPAKEGLLGMEAGRKWILLANFMDHSNMRNSLALEIARRTSLDWTPSGRFVDVFVNGKLQGLYLLVEPVEVKTNRLNIDQKKGFLLEGDRYEDEALYYTAVRELPYHIKYPGEPSDRQIHAISSHLNEIEQLLYKDGTGHMQDVYKKYIDPESFADWWIVHELTQNAEPNGPRSCYMHDNGDGRLQMGPVWDFDLAFIDVGLDKGGDIRPSRMKRTDVKPLTGDSLYNTSALWYGRLLQDAAFRRLVQQRWKKLRSGFRALVGQIDRWQAKIEPSALDNEQLWKGQDPARFDIHESFRESADNLRKVYEYRIQAMDRLLQSWSR